MPSRISKQRPFHKICELMRKRGAKCYILEIGISEKDHYRYYKKFKREIEEKHSYVKLRDLWQITFLYKSIHDKRTYVDILDQIKSSDILCTTVIPKLEFVKDYAGYTKGSTLEYVYESVIKVEKTDDSGKSISDNEDNNHFVHVASEIEIIVLGKPIIVTASYFAQADQINGVCAHASIKMSLIHLEDREKDRFPPTTGEINDILLKNDKDFKALDGLNFIEIEIYPITAHI